MLPDVFLNALGMINALGNDVDEVVTGLDNLHARGMGIVETRQGPMFIGQADIPTDHAFPERAFRFDRRLDCRFTRLLCATLTQLSPDIAAARERYGAGRIGVVLGTSTSGISAAEDAFITRAHTGVFPPAFDYRQMEIGMAAPFVASALGLGGPAYTVSTACTSGAKAIAAARRLLQLKLCDAVIVGAADILCEVSLQGFTSLASCSPERTNPMSRLRQGINVGEGAAIFLMSREPRGVRVAGIGESSDAYHISSPDPTGLGAEIALRAALDDAHIDASAIGYVNLHATATPKNDEMEARVMARVFPDGVASSGTKPFTGHQLGAAGATEVGLLWLALSREDVALPRHLWDGQADPALPVLDLVEDRRFLADGRSSGLSTGMGRYAMSNSFAFGGSNASVILGA